MKKRAGFEISYETFYELQSYIDYEVRDFPPKEAEKIKPFLNQDSVVAVFSSSFDSKSFPHGEECLVGGIDMIRLEPETKRKPNEPSLNIYHFNIYQEKSEDGEMRLFCERENLHQPYDHWMKDTELDKIVERVGKQENPSPLKIIFKSKKS